ncbi:DUF397 domain-containing protein [Streptomyces sp. NPDC047000]|uniref:DUF397 domain-containing protein n=1 Tax=Streptomyces sp. NPDC047000 TaxID=3155474 RepID=UPI0033EFD7C4
MPPFRYRKSSYSDDLGECVEVATNIPTTVAIRDSKNPTGPSLQATATAWSAFRTLLVEDEPTPRQPPAADGRQQRLRLRSERLRSCVGAAVRP